MITSARSPGPIVSAGVFTGAFNSPSSVPICQMGKADVVPVGLVIVIAKNA